MGLNTKVHLAMDSHGVPVRCIITGGIIADCSKAEELIDGISTGGLVADKGYDSDDIVHKAEKRGMKVVIPPKNNRKFQRKYDKQVYKTRRLVENTFMLLKRWRGIATRYAKNTASFLAAIHIRCISLWAFKFS